jgi:hypothetical protein
VHPAPLGHYHIITRPHSAMKVSLHFSENVQVSHVCNSQATYVVLKHRKRFLFSECCCSLVVMDMSEYGN